MKRIILILLVASCVFSIFSCRESKEPDTSGTETQTEEADFEIDKTEIDLLAYDSISLVKPYGGTDTELKCSTEIHNALLKFIGNDFNTCTDKKINDESTFEILVGSTAREQSDTVAKNLRINDYYVGICDGKLIIMGANDTGMENATQYFKDNYEKIFASGKITEADCYLSQGEYFVDSVKIGGADITEYSIVFPEGDNDGKYMAFALSNHISNAYGYRICAKSDAEHESKYEILIGQTNRKDSLKEEAKPYWFDIKYKNSKLVMRCGSLWAFFDAVDALDSMQQDNSIIVPKDCDISVRNSSVKETECNFVYVKSKGIIGDTPCKSAYVGENSIEKYSIVYHDYGSEYKGYAENEVFAAAELQKYIEYATGVKLPLKKDTESRSEFEFIIGQTSRESDGFVTIDRSNFGEEGLYIKSVGNSIVIAGGEQRGTLYGVYTFLENYFGCRFFSSDCEIIYKTDRIDIPTSIEIFEKSPFEYRDNSTFSCLSADIAPKMKYNSSYRRTLDYAHGSSVRFLRENEGFVHTMSKYLDLGKDSSQPCLTSEKIYEKAIANIRKYLDGDQEPKIVSVSQNDNNNPCRCSDCARVNREEGSDAGTLIRFVNRIADDLKTDYPNVKVMTLAYMYSKQPTITKPRDNVIVELCNYEDCLAHIDGQCNANSEFMSQLEQWSDISENLYIWNYCGNFRQDYEKTPYMNFDTLYYNNRQYVKAGVKGVFHQGKTENFGNEFGELRAYVLGKIMWNPDMSLEEYHTCIDEFITAYYGPVSEMVKRYFDFLSSVSGDFHYDLYSAPSSVLDEKLFALYSDEIRTWWHTAGVIEKSNYDTKRHCDSLYEGFKFLCEELTGSNTDSNGND
ncbi:MAG: DUF4838 domain-containing protein [Clostridia bacterium]|nr:DUF4838 domain-containing protein [Clostridia bacterium]